MKDQYKALVIQINEDKFDMLDEMHHMTSGFKSMFTNQAYQGLLTIRQALGGAGYSAWSGIPYFIDLFSPQTTFEGDNTVMAIQSTKYLKKLYSKVMRNETINHPVFSYLNNLTVKVSNQCSAKTSEDFCNLDLI